MSKRPSLGTAKKTSRSSSSLDRCLELLEPFEKISRADATAMIERVKADYQDRIAQPVVRRADVHREMVAIGKGARDLLGLLHDASWFSQQFLRGFELGVLPDRGQGRRAHRQRGLGDLDELERRLDSLVRLARRLQIALSDPGGGRGTDLDSRVLGTPNWHLAREAVHLFELCVGRASSTLGGPAHRFAEALLAHASGRRNPTSEIMFGPLRRLLRRRREVEKRQNLPQKHEGSVPEMGPGIA